MEQNLPNDEKNETRMRFHHALDKNVQILYCRTDVGHMKSWNSHIGVQICIGGVIKLEVGYEKSKWRTMSSLLWTFLDDFPFAKTS